LSAQQTIAHYRIGSKLGEGGMGAVYRATDTKLGREVAIKVIPETFAQDPDRLARFTREAQVLASLNHPNIAAIYGVEERALVMELVEGPTLAERIAQGPMPLDEALPIARQIAEALEYAHDRGIVHRDLKPANIKVTLEGRVKVLDFGLAKAFAADALAGDPGSSPTMTMRATMAGMIMGTAGYMSPEQAKGKPVDRRADIWAFGVVLVEMLTGRMMYQAETISETLAAVLLKEPDLGGLPDTTPPAIHRLIRRCLDKDSTKRLQAIGEARIAIDNAALEEAAPAAVGAPAAARRGAPWWSLAAVAVLVLALGVLLWRTTRPVERPMQRFSADLGPDAVPGGRTTAAISPDGARIVFPVRSASAIMLATRLMDQSKATVLSGTEGAADPFFSPDGQWIGFFADKKLKKVSVQGGAAMTLCEVDAGRGAAWGEDGNIILAPTTVVGLVRVPAAGGAPQILTKPQAGENTHRWPQILPGGQVILFTAQSSGSGFDNANIEVMSLKTGQYKVVQRGGYFGRYLPSGHLVFIHQGTLFGVPFDPARFEVRGMPAPLVEDIAGNSGTAGGQFDFSRSGTLVYLEGRSDASSSPIVWMDAAGKQETLLASFPAHPITPRFSPDGKRLALAVANDVYVYDLARSAPLRLTVNPGGANSYPVWAPDGKHIVYLGNNALWWARSDGSGQPQQIYPMSAVAASFSPDGRLLALHQAGNGTGRDIWILPLDTADPDHPKPGKPELFLATKGNDVEPAFSPDGRWLAYTSSDSGTLQVFVRPFPEGAQGGGQAQVSTTGGRFPIWSRSGKELYYAALDGHIMAVTYTATGRTFEPGKPRQWSDTAIGLTGNFPPLDLAPDGKRFAVYPTVGASSANAKSDLHVTFLLNFFDEAKRKLAAGK